MRRILQSLLAGALLLSLPAVASAADARLAALPVRAGALVRAPFAFDVAGARWQGSGSVELRTQRDGRWSSWVALSPADAPGPGGAHVAEPVWTGQGDAVELRSHGAVRGLHAILVTGGSGPLAPPPGPVRRASAVAAPQILTRAQWGADESIRRAPPLYAPAVHMVFVHHTDTTNDYTEAQVPSILRSIEIYHVRANGWNDIGYNYLVDRFGRVWEGRYGGIDQNVIGAQTLGFNTGTVGIAYIGDGQSEPLTAAGRAALVSLISWRLDIAHVDPRSQTTLVSGGNPKYASGTSVTFNAVSGHRDGTLTDCPGNAIYAQLPGIAQDAALAGGPKIFAPAVSSLSTYPVHVSATLSGSLGWTARVLDASGATIASQTGSGSTVSWTWNGRSAAGTAIAPGVAASWRIDAQDASGVAATPASGDLVSAPATTTAAPAGAIAVSPTSISPDGDGQADAATITFTLATPQSANVTVADGTGATVATLLPQSPLPAGVETLQWDGKADDPAVALPDGLYHVVVTTADESDLPTTQTTPLSLVRAATGLTGPKLAVSPNHDGRGDRATFRWQQGQPAHVRLQLTSGQKTIATVFTADLPAGAQHVVWNGASRTRLATGELGALLTLTTPAGTQLLQTTFSLDLTAPTARGLQARTHAGGGFVRFRLSEPAAVQLKVDGHLVTPYVVHRAGVAGVRYALQGRRARRIELRILDPAGNPGRARIVLRR
jgi:flagellar hook assembly protein FlgD